MEEDKDGTVEPQERTDPESAMLDADDIAPDDEIIEEEAIDETETQEEPEKPGETEEKTVETVEDIKKSRAFHQTKAQNETERRKAAETELLSLKARLKPADSEPEGTIDTLPGLTPEERQYIASQMKPPQTAQPQQQAQKEEEDEYNLDIDALLNKRFSEFTDKLVRALDQRDYAREQKVSLQNYMKEVKSVWGIVDEYQQKYEIPKEIREAAEKEAAHFVPFQVYAVGGGPTLRAELVLDKLGQWVVSSKSNAHLEARQAEDNQKLEDVKKLKQPASTGPSAPGKKTAKSVNDKLADDIAPDTSPM